MKLGLVLSAPLSLPLLAQAAPARPAVAGHPRRCGRRAQRPVAG
ncbi:hypothetical protein ACE0DR_25675 [Azotobacter sp. CWF10]